MKQTHRSRFNVQKVASRVAALLLCVASIHPAVAASTAGGGLPFDSWMTTITASITGPYAYGGSVIGVVGAGMGLIFGGADMNGFLRVLIWIVLILSLVVAAKNTISAVTGQGAEVAFLQVVQLKVA